MVYIYKTLYGVYEVMTQKYMGRNIQRTKYLSYHNWGIFSYNVFSKPWNYDGGREFVERFCKYE